MHAVLEELKKIGIIPVVKIDDVSKAVPLARALLSGGIPCAEITFRTTQAEEAMARINKELCTGKVPGILLGAGTVLTVSQVDKAIASGAKYVVSPGFNPKVVSYCIEKGILIIPGCSNPSDVEKALEFKLEAVKFFPAEQAGGLEYIKAISAPYPSMYFIPTGGINADNIAKYTVYDKVLACGGSWMVNADLVHNGEFDRITELCREAIFSLLGFQAVHVGINMENEEDAHKLANRFETLFGFKNRAGNFSIFSSESIEITKLQFYGKNGHIAIATNSVEKARAYFERQGIEFNAESAKIDAKGNCSAIYFREEIGGFAIHLLQRK